MLPITLMLLIVVPFNKFYVTFMADKCLRMTVLTYSADFFKYAHDCIYSLADLNILSQHRSFD